MSLLIGGPHSAQLHVHSYAYGPENCSDKAAKRRAQPTKYPSRFLAADIFRATQQLFRAPNKLPTVNVGHGNCAKLHFHVTDARKS